MVRGHDACDSYVVSKNVIEKGSPLAAKRRGGVFWKDALRGTFQVSFAQAFPSTTMFAQTLWESFDKTFSKVFRAPAAKRRSPLARGETPLRRFSL